jgi:hypothetical protein
MATTTEDRRSLEAQVSSRSGMTASFTSSGALRRLDVEGRSLLLYPASELEAGPGNLYLRL